MTSNPAAVSVSVTSEVRGAATAPTTASLQTQVASAVPGSTVSAQVSTVTQPTATSATMTTTTPTATTPAATTGGTAATTGGTATTGSGCWSNGQLLTSIAGCLDTDEAPTIAPMMTLWAAVCALMMS
jgi:hypothetical protein